MQQLMVLRQQGVTHFMVACDPGVGLYAAEAMNILRESEEQFCVTPHEGQATKWAPYLRERYFTMLEKCTYMSAACKRKTPGCQLDAYKSIIDGSDVVHAVYDPASHRGDDVDKAMEYAAKQGKQMVLIYPDNFYVDTY